MIRLALPEDSEGLLSLAKVTGLFEGEQIQELSNMLAQSFDNSLGMPGLWITDYEHQPVGIAYVAPERMTHGTWNLYLLAVHPDYQRQGRGTALLDYVEHLLIAQGERILLVETSGTKEFACVRQFYSASGYEEEARIRDFYDDQADKIIFRKSLIHKNKMNGYGLP